MPSDKASPGERFQAPSAATWNRMVDAGNAYAEGRLEKPKVDPTKPLPTDLISVLNATCGNRRKGEVVKICDKAVTNITEEHKWLTGATTDARGCFAILKTAAIRDQVVTAQVSGVCMAWVQVNNESHNRASLVDGQVVLRSATTGQCEILYKDPGLGERFCVVRISQSCVSQAEQEDEIPRTTNCTGSCQWSWVSGAWVLVSNECSPTTSTTGEGTTPAPTTTSEPTTTTTGEPQADLCSCPTSTTTTTTADHCQCLKPLFCAANEGDCTFTSCSKETNELPFCGPTTTTTTTTGEPCDCNTTSTPSGDGNCQWYRDPSGVLRCLDCPPGCLDPPIDLENCQVFISPPVPPEPLAVAPPCSGSCTGGTLWYCIPEFGTWFPEPGSTCSRRCPEANDGRCLSPPPTLPCEECGKVFEPCVFVPFGDGTGSTTTTGEPTTTTTSVYDTSCGICYGSTTTSTTTTGSCEGTCRLKWSPINIWQIESRTCASDCGCATPGIDGELPCHVIEVPCVGSTTSTTTTTTGCGGNCIYTAYSTPGGLQWFAITNSCEDVPDCSCPVYPSVACGEPAEANQTCATACGTYPTTTTTTSTTSSTTSTTTTGEYICCDYGTEGAPLCSCIFVPVGETCISYTGFTDCSPTVPFDGTCPTCITPTTTTTSTSTTTTTTTTCDGPASCGEIGKTSCGENACEYAPELVGDTWVWTPFSPSCPEGGSCDVDPYCIAQPGLNSGNLLISCCCPTTTTS